ncbi:MAG: hypothetical protein KDD66_01815 [Bdellovibrionales bacterium]|nr:hypothetical protein [Bdellovibrionales bacterium]
MDTYEEILRQTRREYYRAMLSHIFSLPGLFVLLVKGSFIWVLYTLAMDYS